MKRTITIVGASARAAAFSAARAGFAVRAADLFADVDLHHVAAATQVADYPQGFGQVLADSPANPWMYTGGLENYPELIEQWQTLAPLWGNRGETLRRVRDPLQVAGVLREAGCLVPEFEFDAARVPRDGSWLCKGLRSSGGMHVAAWGPISTADSAQDAYFQRLTTGTACSAVYVAAAGSAVLLGTSRQLIGEAWTGATAYRYCGSIGPLAWSAKIDRDFQQIGQVLAKAFGLVGLFGVDVIVNEDGVWVLEINPRYTASVEVLERARGFHAVALHESACVEGRLPANPSATTSRYCGKAILFARRSLTAPSSSQTPWLEPCIATWPTWADLPAPGTNIAAGSPILTILSAATSERELVQQLQSQAAHAWEALENRTASVPCD